MIKELQALLNAHSCENASNTPDFILASYLRDCLAAFDAAVQQRETWYGRDARPSGPWPPGAAEAPPAARKDYVADADGTLRCTQCGKVLATEVSTKLREIFAAYVHEAWSGWMAYLFSQGSQHVCGGTLIPPELVVRWKRQLSTPYVDLPEEEKESDRAEADKILEICRQHATLKFTGWFLSERGAVEAVLKESNALRAATAARLGLVGDVLDALEDAGLLKRRRAGGE